MAIGMTYDEFWYGNTERHVAYRKAHRQRTLQRNYELWLQGAYVYRAIGAMAPAFAWRPSTPSPYVEEPFPIDEKDQKRKEEEAERKRFEEMKARVKNFALKHNQRGT